MTTTATHETTTTRSTPTIREQLSVPLVAVAGLAAVAGIVSGLVQYLNRSTTREHEVAGTSSWGTHLCLTGAAFVLLVVARVINHHRRPGRLLVLAPVGRSAQARLRSTVGPHSAGRLAIAALPLALCVYSMWRAGEQITGGMDPNFTTNAWGGPGYLGAMFCHYLDCGLIVAACTTLLNLILRRDNGMTAS